MKILVTAPFSAKNRSMLCKAAKDCEITFDESDKAYCEADAIIGDISVDKLPVCKNLKWLQITSAGADRYIYDKNLDKSVILTNTTGAFGEIISEYIIGTVLAMYRGFFRHRKNQQQSAWVRVADERLIYGSKVLILGCGNIGSKTAVRLKAMGAETVGIRKTVRPADGFDAVYGVDRLDRELPLADIVIGCMPETPLTRHMLDEKRLAGMKKDALIVNVGRGSLIDTDALAGLLVNGHLFGAVLDVFEQEPLPSSSPLWEIENVFITPHISGPSFGHSEHTQRLIAEICAENLERFLSGKPLKNRVDFDTGYAEKSV